MRPVTSISVFIILLMSLLSGCGVRSGNLVKEYNDFGVKCAKMGLWNEAIMRWKRVVEIEPDNAPAHNNLGVAYESKGNFGAAMAEYKIALELDPDNKVYMSNYSKFKRNYERVRKRNETQNTMSKFEDLGIGTSTNEK